MKTQHIIWFILGMGLLASMAGCKSNGDRTPALADEFAAWGYINSSDGYIKAADMLDPLIANSDNSAKVRKELCDVQIRLLDSAAVYRVRTESILKKGDKP